MNKDIILNGDVYASLNYLKDNSITAAITSPPYWKQRDYKIKNQIGQEKTVEEYIGKLVTIYNELYKKMRNDGIFFLNIGDKYINTYGKSYLLQIPYRLVYHMVKNGWYLEDIIIWYKTNHMPSSVKDRFTNTYEPIFVLAKNKQNIYKKNFSKILEIPLQQTPWKHTAVYPEKLVEEMLSRLNLKDNDLILDPFAGTGTTGVVVKKLRENIYHPKIYSIMIEKNSEFVEIIKERTNIKNIIHIKDLDYKYDSIKENFDIDIRPKIILTNKNGEVYIAETENDFLSVLKGILTDEFKKFHREDALYFIGVKNWSLNSLYYAYGIINQNGYVLRNMIIVSDNKNWYPIFMFAKKSTRVSYKFYLDRVRKKSKIEDKQNWSEKKFIGMKVKDITEKTIKEGYIIEILEKYNDEFPKLVTVKWDEKISIEFIIHPGNDEFLMEGLKFFCPKCNCELIEPFDPLGNNICPFCKEELWKNIDTIPLIKEPEEIKDVEMKFKNFNIHKKNNLITSKSHKSQETKDSESKFSQLERINWGASPGARKIVLGEYFTKMRLYRICLLYTSPSPRDGLLSRMPSSA
jgi:site-specific DNA-methyltransferase (cytosine-N4-specific)